MAYADERNNDQYMFISRDELGTGDPPADLILTDDFTQIFPDEDMFNMTDDMDDILQDINKIEAEERLQALQQIMI